MSLRGEVDGPDGLRARVSRLEAALAVSESNGAIFEKRCAKLDILVAEQDAEIEEQAALAPGLNSEAFHRNTGRLSALRDLQAALAELWRRTHPR